jgi:hypothetical protein
MFHNIDYIDFDGTYISNKDYNGILFADAIRSAYALQSIAGESSV